MDDRKLTLVDFMHDLNHHIVRGSSKKVVLDHIEVYYSHIKDECVEYVEKWKN